MTNIDLKICLFVAMVGMHLLEDFFLQKWTAQAKQKKWWEENAPQKLYRYDYICALAVHSIGWSICIHVPIIVYAFMNYISLGWFWLAIPINAGIHAIIDNLKANKLKINLIEDQVMHFVQIAITWTIFILISL